MRALWGVLFMLLPGILLPNSAQADSTYRNVTLSLNRLPPLIDLELEPLVKSSSSKWKPSLRLRLRRVSQIQSEPLQNDAVQPPKEWGLLFLQGFSGAIVATVSSIVLQSLLDIALINSQGQQNQTRESIQTAIYVRSAIVFAAVPWLVGGIVYGLGKLSNMYEGSFWWALLGGYAGQLLSVGLNALFVALDTTTQKSVARGLGFVFDGLLTGLGAILLYALFQTPYKGIQTIGSLLQLRKGQWSWGIPLPNVAQVQGETIAHISILSGRF